jgi:hypothetical protein
MKYCLAYTNQEPNTNPTSSQLILSSMMPSNFLFIRLSRCMAFVELVYLQWSSTRINQKHTEHQHPLSHLFVILNTIRPPQHIPLGAIFDTAANTGADFYL